MCRIEVFYLYLVPIRIVAVLRLVPQLVYDGILRDERTRKRVGICESPTSIFLGRNPTSCIVGILYVGLSFRIDELRDGVISSIGSASRILETNRLGCSCSIIDSDILEIVDTSRSSGTSEIVHRHFPPIEIRYIFQTVMVVVAIANIPSKCIGYSREKSSRIREIEVISVYIFHS